MEKLKLYKIKDAYVEYLHTFDDKVLFNKKEKRVYIGIIYNISNVKYCIPLSSPKSKHLTMHNSVDFSKINNGKDGAINFNNMIPVIDEVIIDFDVMKEEVIGYRNILFNQIRFIKRNKEEIKNKANDLYEKITVHKSQYLIERCVDFKLLEEKCLEYNSNKEVAVTENKHAKVRLICKRWTGVICKIRKIENTNT